MSFPLPDSTKAPDETSANNSFACSVDFIRDAIVKIKMRDESYPVDKKDFVATGIDK